MPNAKTRMVMAAGTAGGMAEVIWILVAASVLDADAWSVARAVGSTLVPSLVSSNLAPWMGLLIHFLLSIVVATLFFQLFGRRLRPTFLFLAALVSLAAVWAINFLILLPLINPGFVSLLPHPVTLISKLLFGLAMAAVLIRKDNSIKKSIGGHLE